jgi:hypothetical protein
LITLSLSKISAQQETIAVQDSLRVEGDIMVQKNEIDNLAPAKAAFYSAVLPGLGQTYNKQYWKIPLVYGAIGAGVYFYTVNNNEYQRFRTAYFDRQNGLTDEFPLYQDDVLISAQKYYRRQRDTAMLLTILAYVLNIVDANVSAHLKQWNVNDDLSLRAVQMQNGFQNGIGVQLNFKLK